MSPRQRLFISALTLLAFSACTHAGVREVDSACKGVDWWEAGRTDGVAGVPFDESLKANQTRCQAKSHPFDLEAFQNGHDAGLVDYCTPAQGLALGRSGLPYENSCPANLEGPFLQQYEMGAKIHATDLERSEAHVAQPPTSTTTL